MNWPPLSPGLTTALSDVLEAAYQQKPSGGLLDFVVDELQKKSGWDADEYAAEFEKACKVVRTYKLEDECPPEADPYSWIRKRYNDEAIISFLRQRGAEGARMAKDGTEVLQELSKYIPELAYIRDRPDKKAWFQKYTETLVAIVQKEEPEEETVEKPLITDVREILETESLEVDWEEAIAVAVMSVLQDLPEVKKHQKEGPYLPFSTFEAVPGQYPTLFRGSQQLQDRLRTISALPEVLAPMLNGECLPAQLLRLKEAGGVEQLCCYQAAAYLASFAASGTEITERVVENAQRAIASVADVVSKTVHVINSQYLEKTAKAADYPFTVSTSGDRNPLQCRSVLRLSLLTGLLAEEKGCFVVEETFAALSASEKQTLQRELCKDGVLQYPAMHLVGAKAWMSKAREQGQLQPALQLLATIFQEVTAEIAGASLREPNVTVDMAGLLAVAAALTKDSAPIDSTAVTVERSGNIFAIRAHRI